MQEKNTDSVEQSHGRRAMPETPPKPFKGTFPLTDSWVNAAKVAGREDVRIDLSLYPAELTPELWGDPVPSTVLWRGNISAPALHVSMMPNPSELAPNLDWVRNAILDHLVAQGRVFDDGPRSRLYDFSWDGEGLTLVVQRGSYFDYLATNWAAGEGIMVLQRDETVPVRELVEPGPMLTPLSQAKAANHLGVAVMLLCEDHVLINVRGKQATYPGRLDLSASGVLAFEESDTDPFRHVLTELAEEAGLGADNVDVDSLRLIGLSREHRRAGKPDLFFTVRAQKPFSEVKEIVAQRRGVDSDESTQHFWLSTKELATFPKQLQGYPMSPVVQTGLWLLVNQPEHGIQ